GIETEQVRILSSLLGEDARVCLCPTILQEVLQGLIADKAYSKIHDNLLSQEILLADPVMAAVKAAELYGLLRKKGVTIRKSNDCLIAFHAIHFDAKILHKDRDFSFIALHTNLKI